MTEPLRRETSGLGLTPHLSVMGKIGAEFWPSVTSLASVFCG
jgi:hypothetical protein